MTSPLFAKVCKAAVGRLLQAVLLLTALGTAHAQDGSASANDAVKSAVAAQKAKRHDLAIQQFSQAIASGQLARRELTYALYRRAISNRALKRPAQAISDLNSALFFKGDLSALDRADAIEVRAMAYRDAGLKPTTVASASGQESVSPWVATPQVARTEGARVVTSAPPRVAEPIRLVEAPKPASSWPAQVPILGSGPGSAAEGKPAPAVSKRQAASGSVVVPAFQTRVAAAPVASSANSSAPPTTRRPEPLRSYAAPSVERGAGVTKSATDAVRRKPVVPAQPWQRVTETTKIAPAAATVQRLQSSAPERSSAERFTPIDRSARTASVRTAAAADAATPRRQAPPVGTSAAGSVGTFLTGLFGGGPQSEKRADELATGSVTRMTQPSKPASPAGVAVVQEARAPAAGKESKAAVLSKASSRGYVVQVAVLHDKFRAEALAQQLMVHYSGGFWRAKKEARVDETTVADGAQKYAVKIGPYETRADTDTACRQFQADGLECQVLEVK